MVTLEVGKQYKTEDGAVVHCVYMDGRAACQWFLLVVEKTKHTFWSNGSGKGEDGINVVKELAPRKTRIVWLNVYEDDEDKNFLYGGDPKPSLDAARAANAGGRVGVVQVELVNNIETGEVEG